MGLEDLMANKKGKPKKVGKKVTDKEPKDELVHKSIRMKQSTVDLLYAITYHEKSKNNKYLFGDAITDALELLAEKNGVEH